ncbi:hypothetical protein GCM10010464_13420 [Pseudonocardia yunnanensis]
MHENGAGERNSAAGRGENGQHHENYQAASRTATGHTQSVTDPPPEAHAAPSPSQWHNSTGRPVTSGPTRSPTLEAGAGAGRPTGIGSVNARF